QRRPFEGSERLQPGRGGGVEQAQAARVEIGGEIEFVDEAVEELFEGGTLVNRQDRHENINEPSLRFGRARYGHVLHDFGKGTKIAATNCVGDLSVIPFDQVAIQNAAHPALRRWNEIASVGAVSAGYIPREALMFVDVGIDDLRGFELPPVGNVILDFVPLVRSALPTRPVITLPVSRLWFESLPKFGEVPLDRRIGVNVDPPAREDQPQILRLRAPALD